MNVALQYYLVVVRSCEGKAGDSRGKPSYEYE